MNCKDCRWLMGCVIFADSLENHGVKVTAEIADSICESMRAANGED